MYPPRHPGDDLQKQNNTQNGTQIAGHSSGTNAKEVITDLCDRIKSEYTNMYSHIQNLKSELEKASSHRADYERHHNMFNIDMTCFFTTEVHKMMEVIKRLTHACSQQIPYLPQELQASCLQLIEQVKHYTTPDIPNSYLPPPPGMHPPPLHGQPPPPHLPLMPPIPHNNQPPHPSGHVPSQHVHPNNHMAPPSHMLPPYIPRMPMHQVYPGDSCDNYMNYSDGFRPNQREREGPIPNHDSCNGSLVRDVNSVSYSGQQNVSNGNSTTTQTSGEGRGMSMNHTPESQNEVIESEIVNGGVVISDQNGRNESDNNKDIVNGGIVGNDCRSIGEYQNCEANSVINKECNKSKNNIDKNECNNSKCGRQSGSPTSRNNVIMDRSGSGRFSPRYGMNNRSKSALPPAGMYMIGRHNNGHLPYPPPHYPPPPPSVGMNEMPPHGHGFSMGMPPPPPNHPFGRPGMGGIGHHPPPPPMPYESVMHMRHGLPPPPPGAHYGPPPYGLPPPPPMGSTQYGQCQSEMPGNMMGGNSRLSSICAGIPSRFNLISSLNHLEVVCSVSFSKPFGYVYTGSKGSVKVWDISEINNPRNVASLDCLKDNYVRAVRSINNNKVLIVSGEHSSVGIWSITTHNNVVSLNTLTEFNNPAPVCYDMAISTDEKYCYCCLSSGSVAAWDIEMAKPVRTYVGHSDGSTCIDVARDGSGLIYTGGLDSKVFCWDGRDSQPVRNFTFPTQVFSLSCSPYNDFFVVGLENKNIELFFTKNIPSHCGERQVYRIHESCVLTVNISHNGKWMLTSSKDNYTNCVKLPQGIPVFITREISSILCTDISPDDRYIVTGGGERRANIYECIYGGQ